MAGSKWTVAAPSFIVLESQSAPKDLVWVTGADEATYRDIRGMTVYRYDPNAVVQIRRPTRSELTYGEAAGVPPDWYDWAMKQGTADEKAAAVLVRQQAKDVEWVPYPEGHKLRGDYYGEVRFPREQPNTSGMILVRRADLEFPATP